MVEMATHEITQKPWGYEEILTKTEAYVVKRIVVRAGHQLSLQYHKEKVETLILVDGAAFIVLPKQRGGFNGKEIYVAKSATDPIVPLDTNEMEPQKPYHVQKGRIHRVGAPKDSPAVLIEISTTQLDDVVRIRDDYNR